MGGNRACKRYTKGKGKNWARGKSSSSNPETRKYRDAARNVFYNANKQGAGGLTLEALAHHNVLGDPKEETAMDVEEVETQSVGARTFDTFASHWSDCSNPAFDKLIRNWQPSSAAHKDMLAILAAVTEIIKSEKETNTESFSSLVTETESLSTLVTETEYFGALMTVLDDDDTTEERTYSCLTLLGMVLSRVPSSVLKRKFSYTSEVFIKLFRRYINSANPNLVKTLLGCVSVVLRAQEAPVWGHMSVAMRLFDGVLALTISSLPKVRKAAQHAICAILKGSSFMLTEDAPEFHPAAKTASKFCVKTIMESKGESSIILAVLGLLKDTLAVFPGSDLKNACDTIMSVLTLGKAIVTASSLQTLHSMFIHKPRASCLSAEVNGQLITALYFNQPNKDDLQPLQAWLLVMQEALINLHRLNPNMCLLHLPKFFSKAAGFWLSNRGEVLLATAATLKTVLQQCVAPLAETMGAQIKQRAVPIEHTHVCKILDPLEKALTYQYHPAWKYVVQILGTFFEVVGRHCGSITKGVSDKQNRFITEQDQSVLLSRCLKLMAELRESFNFAHQSELDNAIGMAVKVMGPRIILASIPLMIDQNVDNFDFQRSWLLPVLRDHIQETELDFFRVYFLPMAVDCKEKAKILISRGQKVEGTTYDLIQMQIWSLLPGFCNRPTDFKQNFQFTAKALGESLESRPDLRQTILSCLRLLINTFQHEPDNIAVLSHFAKNYLIILFRIYTSSTKEESVRRAVFDTIKVYLGIASQELCWGLYGQAFAKLGEQNDKCSMLDLIRLLMFSLDEPRLTQIYEYILPMLDDTDKRLQKKAYRLIEELCSSSGSGCREFVSSHLDRFKETLLSSSAKVAPLSRAARLRCLTHVIKHLQPENREFLVSSIPEVVLALNPTSSSIKARAAANILLLQLAETLVLWASESPLAEKAALKEFFQLMLSGLTSNPDETCATILGLASCLWKFKVKLSPDIRELVINRVCSLLQSSEHRAVHKSALIFVRQLTIIFKEYELAPHLEFVLESITSLPHDRRHALRQKISEIITKLIKKFGAEMIGTFVPESLYKLIHHIQKTQNREKRQWLERKSQKEEDDDGENDAFTIRSQPQTIEDLLRDSDSELEDDVAEPRKSTKKVRRKALQTFIAEDAAEGDVMDLLDPRAAQRITTVRPEQSSGQKSSREVKHDFKMTKDGRLIITDGDVESETEDKGSVQPTTKQLLQAIAGPKNMSGKRSRFLDEDEEGEDKQSDKYQAGGKGIHRPLQKKKPAAYGAEFKAKKAGGDIKRKGRPDPYAYIPFNYQVLNRRKKSKFSGQFKNIVRSAKKGANMGTKNKARAERKMKK